jgi:histidine triad (HIT) family protein
VEDFGAVTTDSCIFCAIVSGDAPAYRLHEDERTLAFLDINPWGRGHTLVVPKRHAENLFEIDAGDYAAVTETVRTFGTRLRDAAGADGLAVAQLNGAAAGQEVFHLHVHLVPRRAGEGIPTGPLGAAQDDLEAVHRQLTAAL